MNPARLERFPAEIGAGGINLGLPTHTLKKETYKPAMSDDLVRLEAGVELRVSVGVSSFEKSFMDIRSKMKVVLMKGSGRAILRESVF